MLTWRVSAREQPFAEEDAGAEVEGVLFAGLFDPDVGCAWGSRKRYERAGLRHWYGDVNEIEGRGECVCGGRDACAWQSVRGQHVERKPGGDDDVCGGLEVGDRTECVRSHEGAMSNAPACRGSRASRSTWRSAMRSPPQAESPPNSILARETAVLNVPGAQMR